MSKYTEYVSSQAANQQFKADLYAKTSAQPLRNRRLSTPLKAVLSVSAAAVIALAVVLPVTLYGNSQTALRKSYSKVFANIAETVIKSGKGSAATNMLAKKSIGNAGKIIPIKYVEPQDNSTLYGVAANVYFYSQLYLSEKFIISDEPVHFAISGVESNYYVNDQSQESVINYDIVLQSSMDRKNGIVTSQMILREEQTWQSGPSVQNYDYLNLYVEYDFDRNKVISYTAAWRSTYDKNVSYGCYRYYDNKLTELDVSISDGDYKIFAAGMDDLQEKFEGQEAIPLDADFKEEYLRSELYLKEMLA